MVEIKTPNYENQETKKTNPTNLEDSKKQAEQGAKKAQELASQGYDPEADELLEQIEHPEIEKFNKLVENLKSNPKTQEYAKILEKKGLEGLINYIVNEGFYKHGANLKDILKDFFYGRNPEPFFKALNKLQKNKERNKK